MNEDMTPDFILAYLVEVDSEAGGRDAQQRRHAFGPRHQPTCPPTQSRTLVITI